MIEKVFSISGRKLKSLILDEDSIKISSSTDSQTIQGFREAFKKKLTLDYKVEIPYNSILSIEKEMGDDGIQINYESNNGQSKVIRFSFVVSSDQDFFYRYFEEEKNYSRWEDSMTSMEATKGYYSGLFITLLISAYSYIQAQKIELDPSIVETYSRKAYLYFRLVQLLGAKGVLVVSFLFVVLIVYFIITRHKNPPNSLKLYPA